MALPIVISALLFGCTPEQNRIDQKLAATEKELSVLPHIKVDTLVPTLGHISAPRDSEDSVEQITVTFPEPKPIDTVVLVPANSLSEQNEFVVSRFPVRFKIEAQTGNGELIRIADHTQSDVPCPGIAPALFTLSDDRPVKELTMTITKLPLGFEGEYFFLLNELLVFSGEENIALNAAVSCETERNETLRFAPAYLVDGYTYFPPFKHKLSSPYLDFRTEAEEAQIFFDLGKEQTLNEARFYPNDFMTYHSHIHSAALGFPMEIELRLSPSPSFEHVNPIIITKSEQPVNMSSSPLCKKFTPITGRYVQITLRNGRKEPLNNDALLSLSEIELLNNGINRLAGIPFRTAKPLKFYDSRPSPPPISPNVLTDGKSVYGKIIPQKQWFLQLARRAELEKKTAGLLLEKDALYNRQKKELRTLLFSIPVLALLILLFLLGNRYRNQQKIQQVRERIADNLHDETGATLSSIANSAQLLAELSSDTNSDDEAELIADIIESAERSAKETRALILFLEKNSSQGDLIDRFRDTARQMLYGFELTLNLQAEKQFNQLIPIRKWDLLLFFKEVLNNIIKHADADAVIISTQKKGQTLCLEIRDNGKGLPPDTQPNHLSKRAKKLNAKIEITSPETGGTRVTCTLSRL